MESLTTQKLSFLPVKLSSKEQYPWAQKAVFKPPTDKMESKTTQKLSYIPPGYYIEDYDCPCQLTDNKTDFSDAPKAAIY